MSKTFSKQTRSPQSAATVFYIHNHHQPVSYSEMNFEEEEEKKIFGNHIHNLFSPRNSIKQHIESNKSKSNLSSTFTFCGKRVKEKKYN